MTDLSNSLELNRVYSLHFKLCLPLVLGLLVLVALLALERQVAQGYPAVQQTQWASHRGGRFCSGHSASGY